MTSNAIVDQIREKALAEGFDAIGFSSPDPDEKAAGRLEVFLRQGFHGDMGWLESKSERRKSPTALWPEVGTVIALGANYGPDHNPIDRLEELRHDARGNVSVYARNLDYHDVLKKRLKVIGRWMCDTFDCEVKVFVDTAPVLEKPIAQRAGLGWQGKHTNLVSRAFGSWLFLAEIYTTLTLAPTAPENDHCGTCQQCVDICPTNAFPAPYRLDARRCISYLTIEHKGHIAAEFRKPMGTRIYGCDDCLSVCPWNKFARASEEPAFAARADLEGPELRDLLRLDDTAFREFFRKSPVKRTGRARFLRNTLIAAGNSGDAALSPDIKPLLDDPSPLVRAMAVWALGRLLERDEFNELSQQYEATETDATVRAEWQAPELSR